MMISEKPLYTAKAHTIGGREGGFARTSDGRLQVALSPPGGSGRGTNPEQLFAIGWSACFISAIKAAAAKMDWQLPNTAAVDAEVDLDRNRGSDRLRVRLNVTLPGVEPDVAQALVHAARGTCPYSKATQGNISISTNLITN